MEILKSWEGVGFFKPSGVVIGAPEEQKRGLSASNSNARDINSWTGRLEFLIPMVGFNRDEDHQGECCLLNAGQTHIEQARS